MKTTAVPEGDYDHAVVPHRHPLARCLKAGRMRNCGARVWMRLGVLVKSDSFGGSLMRILGVSPALGPSKSNRR